ncbi:RidA family protein [Prescottella agglutinans]|uniref:RidA family protein n=1 Tax=Prescottella agglutinans TaxID=1644129 RepID=UPI003D95109E
MTVSRSSHADLGLRNRLQELGCRLPDLPPAAGSYLPAVRSGSIVYTSGQLPVASGSLLAVGKVGGEVVEAEAAELVRTCVLNALAAAATVADLDSIVRILKVTVFVASAPGFNRQAQVANAASELLETIFGSSHARSAVGVAELPLNAPVEIELVAEVRG